MGKQGPCYHCGVTSTPLWRNGPPEKPVLCNACGSRWRTKGTLANYTPLHARADSDVLEDHRAARMKTISLNKNKEAKLLKRKPNHDSLMVAPSYGQGTRKVVDEDTSNRSSSGSAISNSESCAQFGSADGSDLTGPAQSNVWETMVPSKKRTCFNRPKQSSVEKLTKDLHTILHQQQQSSYFSGSSEEDLLFESETPMVSVEIGHGSVLIRHPSSLAREEESEASSLSVENKHYALNEAYSHYMLPVNNEGKGANFSIYPSGRQMQAEPPRRDKPQHETLQILGCQSSPLCNIDLNDILNYEEFVKHLTIEEQVQLLNYLPQVDNTEVPQSLNSLFDSPQFKENLSSFQQLLGEGIFDFSFAEVKTEDCKALRRLALFNLTKSHWVEKYQFLKENTAGESFRGMKNSLLNNSVNMKRSCDIPGEKLSEAKSPKSPKRLVMKASCENKEVMDNDGSCFSPTSLFSFPPEGGSLMLDPSNFVDESSDQDLLLDVPSNGSFAEAELLDPNLNFGRQASASSSSSYRHLTHP